MDHGPRLIAVMGPTGSGKSDLAERLADSHDAELVNADAFMVYRGFDIGTNKPDRRDRYRLLDIRDPIEPFGVGAWIDEALPILERAYGDGRNVIVVGGTGLYIRSLFEEYAAMQSAPDPELRAEIMRREHEEGLPALFDELRRRDPDLAGAIDGRNPARVRRALEKLMDPRPTKQWKLPPFRKVKLALACPAEILENALSERVERMFAAGWPDEVRWHLSHGVPRDAPAMRAIGYDTVIEFVGGSMGADEAQKRILIATRQYAKRQRTWLRSERDLIEIPVSSLDETGASRAFEKATETLRL